MFKKIFKYIGPGLIVIFLVGFITFYFLIVQSYEIVITEDGETKKYYSYCPKAVLDFEKEEEKTIMVYLNHQKFWSLKYWVNFPDAPEFSSITLKFKNHKLEKAYTTIIDYAEVKKSPGASPDEILLEGEADFTGNVLSNVKLNSYEDDNMQISYYLRKIDFAEKCIFSNHIDWL